MELYDPETLVEVLVEVRDTLTINDTTIIVDTVTIALDIFSPGSEINLAEPIIQGASVQLTANFTSLPNYTVGPLIYSWFVSGGELDQATGDTVMWKAPDDTDVYSITVHATDGEYIGIGSRTVGVGMYAPTVTPFFLGGTACANCHSGNTGEWDGTAHSHAWATLQESGHPRSFCNPCHTVDNRVAGNSGYDDAPIAKFENVQCESCHGPASAHVNTGGAPDITQIDVDWSAEACATCHQGTHHPFFDEWVTSPHGNDGFFLREGFCGGCHEGVAAALRLSGDVSQFYGGGSIAGRPDTSAAPVQRVVCVTCHDPHNAENPGQLRTVADVPLVTANGRSPVITIGGSGKLCMHCHHARRAGEFQIDEGYGHFGPHANPQADMMAGETGYEAVALPGETWADPSHLNVQNSCKTCHLNMIEFGGGPGGAAAKGHTFLPTVEACVNCHGAITAFTDISALDDFDGDGSVEGLQLEVAGLLHKLETAIVDSMLARGVDTTNFDFEHLVGDSSISTFKERQAGWNYFFVEEDKSHGVHNPDYAIQLLQRTWRFYTGSTVPNAVILDNGQKAVAKF